MNPHHSPIIECHISHTVISLISPYLRHHMPLLYPIAFIVVSGLPNMFLLYIYIYIYIYRVHVPSSKCGKSTICIHHVHREERWFFTSCMFALGYIELKPFIDDFPIYG